MTDRPVDDDRPSTRPVDTKDALDQALADACARLRPEPALAEAVFTTMRDLVTHSGEPATALELTKKLVATALARWCPPTTAGAELVRVAERAGLAVQGFGTAAVVRERTYETSCGVLSKPLARSFSSTVLLAARDHLQAMSGHEGARRFAAEMPELVRLGSLSGNPPAAHFVIST